MGSVRQSCHCLPMKRAVVLWDGVCCLFVAHFPPRRGSYSPGRVLFAVGVHPSVVVLVVLVGPHDSAFLAVV